MKITQSELVEALHYDPETGVFHWIKPRKKVVVGSVAGGIDKNGYRVIKVGQWPYFAHRLAWLYMYGRWPEGPIDHKNHSKDDNRLANLRECTPSENMQNRRGAQRNSKTGVLGVSPTGRRFHSAICVDGQQIFLGHYKTLEDAAAAYQKAKAELHPFTA